MNAAGRVTAIETSYKGYLFRSRLEARWAVFFDRLGVAWRYEDEGYKLPDGQFYLPDFFMPNHGVFIEVKPSGRPSDEERSRCAQLSTMGANVWLVAGDPFDHEASMYLGGAVEFQMCRLCMEDGRFLPYLTRSHEKDVSDSLAAMGRPPIQPHENDKAARAARSARFEHGAKSAA